MYKKKEKKKSPVTDWLAKQREQEWTDAMKKTEKFLKTKSIILEEKEKMKRLKKKYGIKEQRDSE